MGNFEKPNQGHDSSLGFAIKSDFLKLSPPLLARGFVLRVYHMFTCGARHKSDKFHMRAL